MSKANIFLLLLALFSASALQATHNVGGEILYRKTGPLSVEAWIVTYTNALSVNADRDSLVAGIKARGHRHALPLESSDKLAGMVAELAGPGDYVVCLGAGNITQWAHALPGELKPLLEVRK